MTTQILNGIRIIDLTSGIAGPVASMLLAESGAEVIKIENPEYCPDREKPGFAVWNRSKKSCAINIETEMEKLDHLLESADVLVHDLNPSRAKSLKLDDHALHQRMPHLIVSHISGFPLGHLQEELPPNDTLVLAEAGIMDEQKGSVRDGPIFIRFPLGSWGAAYLAANGILARLICRDRSGDIGPAHTSLLQGALIPMAMHWSRAETPSDVLTMGMPKDGLPSMFECADGVWLHLMAPPDETPLMKQALEALGPDKVDELNKVFDNSWMGFANFGANWHIFKTRPHKEWLEDLWANDIPVQPATPMGEIYFDEQAQANNYVLDVDDPKWGATRQPGHPFTTTPPSKVQNPAPILGADTESALAPGPKKHISNKASKSLKYPLSGVKVLDFGNFLAGPLAAMQLSDLGADVIKVEATTGDMMRGTEGAFAGCQRGKRSLALQLKDPQAKKILEKLVKWADIVHHNLRMPAATRLGLDYETLKGYNPNIVYCHVSSYGPKGPRKDWPGYDQLFQASCGWEYEGAGEGNPPIWHRFGMMDHQCAMSSLTATLLGLYHRDKTGQGQFVASSLLGGSLLTVSETIIGPDGKLTPFERLDKNQTGISPYNRIYKCADDDWVAVLASTTLEQTSLLEALGARSTDELEARFSELSADDALSRLASSNVSSAPVRLDQGKAFFDQEANIRCNLVAEYPHVTYGRFEQPGSFWNFGNLDVKLDRAPPGLGQHSHEILSELGYTETEIATFAENGLIKTLS